MEEAFNDNERNNIISYEHIMYYLRLKETGNDRALFKHSQFSRYYRGVFTGIDGKYFSMKLYTCKTIDCIMDQRVALYNYCGEWFDVYDENGKVEDLPPQYIARRRIAHTVYIDLHATKVTTISPKKSHPDYKQFDDYIIIRRGTNFKVYRYDDWNPDTYEGDTRYVAYSKKGSYIIFNDEEDYLSSNYFE